MNHRDHINLIKDGIPNTGGVWADFGSGDGAFTMALAELIGPTGEIYSIDKNKSALNRQQKNFEARFHPNNRPMVHYFCANFTQVLDLPTFNGCVIANALHFQPNAAIVVEQLRTYLYPGGHFIIVEYNIKHGNVWVPHPVPYRDWLRIAKESGFTKTQFIASRPSRTFKEIYAALSINPDN